jgi:hypothetical protein
MMIKKEPVAKITIKNGKMIIEHCSDGKLKPCLYCGKLTANRLFGSPECKECCEFEYSKCKECKFGVKRSRFVCDGEDINDHFEYWIACLKRNSHGDLLVGSNTESTFSVWHVTPPERKKCFIKKVTS